jgi:hypothetical protein
MSILKCYGLLVVDMANGDPVLNEQNLQRVTWLKFGGLVGALLSRTFL